MRGQLAQRPVQVAEVAGAQTERRSATLAHPGAREEHLERQVDRTLPGIVFTGQVGERLRIASRSGVWGRPERLEGIHRHDPGRHGRGEVLREERTERLVFPRLDVARRPVVHEAEAEQVALDRVDRYRFTQRVARADEHANLELVIQPPARAEHRRIRPFRLRLTPRPAHGRAADDERRGPAVVADRHVLVVRQQGVVGTHHPADVHGVMRRRIEVGVVADRGRHEHVRVSLRHQERGDPVLSLVGARRVGVEQSEEGAAKGRPIGRASGHQRVEGRPGAVLRRTGGRSANQAGARAGADVEDQLADRHTYAWRFAAAAPREDPEGKVLDREVGAGCSR